MSDFNSFLQTTLDFNNMIYKELREEDMQNLYEDAIRDFSLQVEM
jgi:hypothetical protein